jgi:hypothetical protein
MSLLNHATPEGTTRHAERFAGCAGENYFRRPQALALSSQRTIVFNAAKICNW